MKKHGLLILSIFLFQSFYSQKNSTITVFSEYGDQFYLSLNGEQQNDSPLTKVTVNNLDQDYYLALVTFVDESKGVLTQKAMRATDLDGNSSHVTYVITVNRKGDQKLRFYSAAPVENQSAQREIEVYYEDEPVQKVEEKKEDRVVYDETVKTTTVIDTNDPDEEVQLKIKVDGLDMDFRMNVGGVVTEEKTEVRTEERTVTRIDETYESENDINIYKGEMEITDVEFEEIKAAIINQDFSDNKKKILQQALNEEYVTADHVKGLMVLFDFEDDKLFVAKYCYSRCTEQNRYFIVNEAFDFEMSVDELDEYIKNQ